MAMPGEFDYDGDCGVSPTPTKTVSGSGGGAVGPEGMHQVPIDLNGKNILAGGGGHGGFVLGSDRPD